MTESDKIPSASSTDGIAQLSGMLSAMLSNPDFMEKLKQIVGDVPNSGMMPSVGGTDTAAFIGANTARAPESAKTEGTLPVFANGMGDGLATVLSNPELLSKLPQMMSMLRPVLEGATTSGNTAHANAAIPREKSSEDCRNELLCALKPFLSPERRHAVDAMLRISQLGNVIRHIK